ncbi:MAG: type III-A CRISPR-associated RAMP protein Csm3 [Thermodesulfobacteriota bacterium]
MERNLLGKVVINGKLLCKTGMHIGAAKENMEIGAIDSPVVRDPITREPYIPGSSFKGKLRSLLEKGLAKIPNRNIGSDVKMHVCDDADLAAKCGVCRIFGSTGKGDGKKNFPARLIVRDLNLTLDSREKLSDIDTGLQFTEWKFENAIDRVTSAANPRQIERVPKGAEFKMELVYSVEEPSHVVEDLKNLRLALELLILDALGGHGSRGYGKVDVKYDPLEAMTVEALKNKTEAQRITVSSLEDEDINTIAKLFSESRQE